MSEMRIVGKPRTKIDAVGKVTGAAKYGDDMMLPRMVYGKLLRSTQPHAHIRRIDVSRARALPGVLDVITGRDLPIHYGVLPNNQDETALAMDRVRYIGEPVAAVAALDEATAERACDLIEVEYEPMKPLLTLEDALDPKAERIHAWTRTPNAHKIVALEFGDIEAAFGRADLVREDTFFYEGNSHVPLETHAVIAKYEGGHLTLWSGTQVPHYVQRALAQVLNIPHGHVRVILPTIGGAFGGKSEPLSFEFCASELSRRTGRPVKIVLTREEQFYTHRGRHPAKMWMKTGVKRDGELTGLAVKIFLDGGAFSSFGIASTYYTGALTPITYKLPAYNLMACASLPTSRHADPSAGMGVPSRGLALKFNWTNWQRIWEWTRLRCASAI